MPYLAKYMGSLQLPPPPRILNFQITRQLAHFSDGELGNKHSSHIWVMTIPREREDTMKRH